MKPQIQVLVGTIASGKSTYARNFSRCGGVVVNDDAIVMAVHGGDYSQYKEELKTLYKTTENHICQTALAMGRAVAIDRGVNLTSESRLRWLGLGKSLDVPVTAVLFPFSDAVTHARRRYNHDDRGHSESYWLEVAIHHLSQLEIPTTDEGFTNVYSVNFQDIKNGRVLDGGYLWSLVTD